MLYVTSCNFNYRCMIYILFVNRDDVIVYVKPGSHRPCDQDATYDIILYARVHDQSSSRQQQ